ncbi:hypothetical protein D3C85_1438170 [compost metagenome]
MERHTESAEPFHYLQLLGGEILAFINDEHGEPTGHPREIAVEAFILEGHQRQHVDVTVGRKASLPEPFFGGHKVFERISGDLYCVQLIVQATLTC